MAAIYQRSIQPWESSGSIFTQGAHALGLSEELRFVDVFSLEETLPGGTLAMILVYPTVPNYEEQKEIDAKKRELGAEVEESPHAVWFSQKVQNACGPYALLHAVFNSRCRHRLGKPRVVLRHFWSTY
jgi:ubiquitin carboxyl-terminal hydrolase L3